ncbi:hypothetical protein L2E82_18475 [Cichorium intybus]|uniref:Uncharacterized protein n=1 Tax=Cichorium intybus TaxID=13427 RepID=A0ACB9F9U7_CICIN|nr:hypothetical protein L2E82_18475 [Cichorium intybus]
MLANDLGTKATRCIRFHTQKFNEHILMKGLRKMKELRFLSVVLGDCFNNLELNILSPEFPNTLRYLQFTHYPLKHLPITFQANNLVALEMVGSRIVQLWEGGERKDNYCNSQKIKAELGRRNQEFIHSSHMGLNSLRENRVQVDNASQVLY